MNPPDSLPFSALSARTLKELRALYRISMAVGASLDLAEAVGPVLRILAEELGMERGTLALLDPDTGELAIEVAHGLTPAEVRRGRYRVGEGVVGRVLERGEPMVIPSIGNEPLFLDRTGSRRGIDRSRVAFLCVPIKVGGDTVGVLSADRLPAAGEDLDDDLRVLTIVAGLVAQAVRIQRMVRGVKAALAEENQRLRHALEAQYGMANFIGTSPARRAVAEQVRLAARTRTPVLITGERGTGKSFVARTIHLASDRSSFPFSAVVCSAGSDEALELVLFGPEGVLRGGVAGTVFLDDVDALGPRLQQELLTAIQAGGRGGGVRVVAASRRELAERVRRGAFLPELYRRLGSVPIHLPPLRQMREDLPAFVRMFLRRLGGEGVSLPPEVEDLLRRYPWPGNLSELEAVLAEALERCPGDRIRPRDLPERIRGGGSADPAEVEAVLGRWADQLLENPPPEGVYRAVLDRVDRVLVRRALARAGGVRLQAARLLGINRNTLYAKLDRMEDA